MTREQVNQYCEEFETDLLCMDGFDDCIEGIIERFGMEPILCYNKQKVIAKLISNGIKNEEEAEEYFQFNQLGAWLGDKTPCFIIT